MDESSITRRLSLHGIDSPVVEALRAGRARVQAHLPGVLDSF